jgi:hypothetical protein
VRGPDAREGGLPEPAASGRRASASIATDGRSTSADLVRRLLAGRRASADARHGLSQRPLPPARDDRAVHAGTAWATKSARGAGAHPRSSSRSPPRCPNADFAAPDRRVRTGRRTPVPIPPGDAGPSLDRRVTAPGARPAARPRHSASVTTSRSSSSQPDWPVCRLRSGGRAADRSRRHGRLPCRLETFSTIQLSQRAPRDRSASSPTGASSWSPSTAASPGTRSG